MNGGEGIGVSASQMLRSLKPSCQFALERDEFRHGAADYLEPQISRHGPILPVTAGRAEFDKCA